MNIKEKGFMVRMIYNNTGSCDHLENAWGLSAWIESGSGITLFDTGGDPKVLKKNMDALSLDMNGIERIVISHDHWDHKGGLNMVLENIGKKTDVYVPKRDEEPYQEAFPQAKVHGIREAQSITGDIWSTGTQTMTYRGMTMHEHSLMLISEDDMIILTGCSHPGIVHITERAKKTFPDKRIKLISGGFHLIGTKKAEVLEISQSLKALGVEKIAPSHCTGDKAIEIFRSEWGDDFVDVNIGDRI